MFFVLLLDSKVLAIVTFLKDIPYSCLTFLELVQIRFIGLSRIVSVEAFVFCLRIQELIYLKRTFVGVVDNEKY